MNYPELHLHIDGEWLGTTGRETLPVINPSTEAVLGQLPIATQADLQRASEAADRGHAVWSRMSAYDRANILHKVADLLRDRVEDIAQLMTLEQGKPLVQSRAEMRNTPDILMWDAEEGRRMYGRVIPSRVAEQRQIVIKEPIGPVATFTPWNYPGLIPVRKISSVLAAGCSCIIKPAEETAATTLAIVKAFIDAGLPKGVLQCVYGNPAEISSFLIASPIIKAIAFTGSTAIGKQLCELSAKTMKRNVMELGGHAPVLVFDDVDVLKVAEISALRKYRNAGQGCVNPTRYYVHDSIYEKFTARFVEVVKSIKVADGFAAESQMGPLAHDRRPAFLDKMMTDAHDHGAKILCGGERIGSKGYFWSPAVIAEAPITAHIMNEEPFGPISVVNRFDNIDAVIKEANRTPYGLASYAFTENGSRAHRLSMELQAGMVGINTFALGSPDAVGSPEPPFGGIKDSGFGSEGGFEGLLEYMTTKFISQF